MHKHPKLILPQRKNPRLSGWDYSATAWYFITICTKAHHHYFGEIVDGNITLSELGRVATDYWLEIPRHFAGVYLDEFVVMPNHVHGIINLEGSNLGLGNIIGNYKSAVTRFAKIKNYSEFGWQSRYYDHIVRDERALNGIRQYILDNPLKWDIEKGHAENISFDKIY